MLCPYCQIASKVVKKGFSPRKTGDKTRVQKFLCRHCQHFFSEKTLGLCYKQHRPELNKPIYILLSSGVSQRRIARLLGTTQTTVARKLVLLGHFADRHNEIKKRQRQTPVTKAVFDEMETFEHSKCKPLSIAVAVEEGSRYVLAAKVAQMPAKGKLAAISRKKYGHRADRRAPILRQILAAIGHVSGTRLLLKSDECPRYPGPVKQILPHAEHRTYKGRRGCVVGQGELKRGGHDPLFSLNHTCAMYRDNLKRLSRRTWCTTKRADRLQSLVNIYACAHNEMIEDKLSKRRGECIPAFLTLSEGRGDDK